MSRVLKATILLLIGGAVYCIIEVAWRGHTHWTMFILGGVCFLLIGGINEYFSWEMLLPVQMLLAAVIITAAELAAGCILNLWLGLGIWDYSNMPLNLYGQICMQYAVLWYLLSAVGIFLDDWLRYWLFGEERPKYKLV